MDFKKNALNLKSRAKELGYDIKLTHAQELLALVSGHKTRHSALKAEEVKNISGKNPFSVRPETINHNCQSCQSRPRTKVHLLHNEQGPDLWYLCDNCTQPSSKFSLEHGAKDVSAHYVLNQICLRDLNFNGAYKSRLNESFQFQLICSDGSLGDIYQFVPGLNTGYAKVALLNVTQNRHEPNGWWYWPVIPL